MNINNLWNHIKCLFLPIYTASKCGHQTKLFGATPRKTWCQMPLEENGSPRYCIECLDKQAVSCVYCGESVFVGEMISLVSKEIEVKPDNKSPLLTVLVDGKPHEIKSYPGCRDCCDYLDLSAYLHPDQEAYHFGSIIERIMSNPGSAIIVSDTSRPESTTTIITL